MSRYRLTRSAKEDLIDHLGYLSDRSHIAAERLALSLLREFRYLAEWPKSGRIRPDLTSASIRFWPVGSYVVIYRKAEDGIIIARITHGSQDLQSVSLHLEEEDEN